MLSFVWQQWHDWMWIRNGWVVCTWILVSKSFLKFIWQLKRWNFYQKIKWWPSGNVQLRLIACSLKTLIHHRSNMLVIRMLAYKLNIRYYHTRVEYFYSNDTMAPWSVTTFYTTAVESVSVTCQHLPWYTDESRTKRLN